MDDLADKSALRLSQTLEYSSLVQRYDIALTGETLSPETEEDDVVVDEEEDDDDDDLDPTAAMELMSNDPELVKQMLDNMQARFKNFEDILSDLRCQLGEMHQRDEEMLKRMAALNEEIAELHLLEGFETRTGGPAAGANTDNYVEIMTDFCAESLGSHHGGAKGPPPAPFHK